MQCCFELLVSSIDEWSGPQNLIAALLLEPLSSESKKLNKTIRNRWKGRLEGDRGITLQCVFIIMLSLLHTVITALFFLERYGACHSKHKTDLSVVRIPAGWFLSTSMKAEITELLPPSADSISCTGQVDSIHPMLFEADIPIILLNTITTPITTLLKHTLMLKNPNAIILLTPKPTTPKLGIRIRSLFAKAGTEPVEGHESEVTHTQGAKVLFVDPESIFGAVKVLRVDPKNPQNVKEYVRSFVDSNIGSITAAMRDIYEKSYKDVLSLRVIKTLTFIQCALEVCKDSIKQAELDMYVLHEMMSNLGGRRKVKVHREVLCTDNLDEVQKAMKEAEEEMKDSLED